MLMITEEIRRKLSDPMYYNNRELSWLAFNERVLEEALDESNPLLERLKFLAIFSSNLDEFFMVRVAGIKDQIKAGFNKPENKAGMTPKQQLTAITSKTHQMVQLQYHVFQDTLLPMLADEEIYIQEMISLTRMQTLQLEKYFEEHILPVLTPMAVDAYRPFPMLLNKSLNLVILLKDKHELSEGEKKQRLCKFLQY